MTPHGTIEASRLYPVHEAHDVEKAEALRANMESAGWQGAPILASQYTHQAWTGSHRLAAAASLGIEVPVVWLDELNWHNPDYIGLDDLRDDDDRLDFLVAMGDADAVEVMRAEVGSR